MLSWRKHHITADFPCNAASALRSARMQSAADSAADMAARKEEVDELQREIANEFGLLRISCARAPATPLSPSILRHQAQALRLVQVRCDALTSGLGLK